MKPRVFWLHVYYFDEPRRRVWTVRQGGRARIAQRVDVRVPTETVFRGVESRQPKAFLRGRGVVRRRAGGVLQITRA